MACWRILPSPNRLQVKAQTGCRFVAKLDTTDGVQALSDSEPPIKPAKFFYGWVIVAVGFLAHIASAFSISSTLSVFLKPLSQYLRVSEGSFH